VPAFRKDLQSIGVYLPGRPIDEVMRDYGVSDVVKLASNECPEPPFAPVQEAIAHAAADVHRYPDSAAHHLTRAIAAHHGLAPDEVWVGPGSSSLLASISHAMGGPGTSAVFSQQSFVLYSIISAIARSRSIAVPLDPMMCLDATALADAITTDTTVLYFCNPNNPTGTYVPPSVIAELVAAVPDDVLVVIDEAYEEYVTHPEHRTAIPHALQRPNVVVARTFSKIYGLAGLRVGYAIGQATTIAALRRLQLPFATTTISLAAAEEALRHQDLVAERAKANARGRDQLTAGLDQLEVPYLDSQTNFMLIRPDGATGELVESLLRHGVIVRHFGEYIRVTVGTESENARFVHTLGEAL
jgi:histidinol-phosphate aminotransferase